MKIISLSTFYLFFCMLLFSCNGKSISCDENRMISNAPGSHGSQLHIANSDSLRKIHLKAFEEPELQVATLESYRYWWDNVFSGSFLFRIQIDKTGKVTLISKLISFGGRVVSDPLNGKAIRAINDTVIRQSMQIVSNQEWMRFKATLDGSYYWALGNPYPNGDGILDGGNLALESKSKCYNCIDDTMQYHSVSIHVPVKGNFKDACKILLQISNLTKNDIELVKRFDL